MSKLSENEEQELRRLCDALVDECIIPAEHEKLEQWIIESSAAAAFYVEHTKLSAALHIFAGTIGDEEAGLPIPFEAESPVSQQKSGAPIWRIAAGLAFLLLAASSIGYFLGGNLSDDSIARLEFVSPNAEFSPNHQLPRSAGSALGKGWVQLESGQLRIRFQSGASVELEGPAAFGIDTPMRSYLDFGRARVHAPESAREFVVATESVEIVDLGTRFEVDVDSQSRESNISVIDGLVDLHLGSRGTERRIQPLEGGFTAHVDASGDIVEITRRERGPDSDPEGDTQLLAHWTFDEPSVTGMIPDTANHHLDGLFQADTDPGFVPGVSGRALIFEGNAHVDLSEHARMLCQAESFTFTAWVRDPSDPMAILFSVSGETERSRVQCHLARGYVVYGWQDGLHYDSVSGRVDGWEAGRWYHVAVALRDGVVRLYRDGELIASGSEGSKIGTPVSNPSAVKNAKHVFLGRLEDGRQGEESAPQSIEGQMDDVQFYSGALDQEAIQFIYEHPGEAWSPKSK